MTKLTGVSIVVNKFRPWSGVRRL